MFTEAINHAPAVTFLLTGAELPGLGRAADLLPADDAAVRVEAPGQPLQTDDERPLAAQRLSGAGRLAVPPQPTQGHGAAPVAGAEGQRGGRVARLDLPHGPEAVDGSLEK